MLNHYFQTIFDEENTELRCKRVLDEISPAMTRLFEQFVDTLDIELGEEYYIHSYDTTLRTTYHDSRNEKYAESKKNTSIGEKYFIGLYRKIGEKEYNVFTLELNGLLRSVLIHTEVNFFPFWGWYKNGQLIEVLSEIPEGYSIYQDKREKETLPIDQMEKVIKDSIKPKRRPSFQIGKEFSFETEISEEELLDNLKESWEDLSGIRHYVHLDKETGKKAFDAIRAISEVNSIEETELFGRNYTVEFSLNEDHKNNGRRQAFYLYEGDQLVIKGYFYYAHHHSKFTPFETLMVQVEGNYQIFAHAREVIGAGEKEWWGRKNFALHNLDNQKVMEKSMNLLKERGIDVDGRSYFIGAYDNERQIFTESMDIIKKRLLDSAIIFAYASEKIQLTQEESGDDSEIEDEAALEPGFYFEQIYQSIENSEFTFSTDTIRDLHMNLTALDDKHFVILSGISGTGKTQLARLYANAVYGLEYESENPYFTIIPVRPDWTDASALFGFYSSFEQRYVKTEFLDVLLSARKEREKPHFVLLDEMNLARVEYYLSDYLSAVESRKAVPLHNEDSVEDVPKQITIPPNVYILGTVNVDETTHAISDKVLDRAFVMTLSDVDFDTYWDKMDREKQAVLRNEFIRLQELHASLATFDLHFGYRTMNEMLRKLHANLQLPEEFRVDSSRALDQVIAEKVLPKIRGDERVEPLLITLHQWLEEKFGVDSVSLQHVKRMSEELEHYGATQFWS